MSKAAKQLDILLDYWQEKLKAKRTKNQLSFDNHIGKGVLNSFLFSDEHFALQFDYLLHAPLEGDDLKDDDGFVNFLFGLPHSHQEKFVALNTDKNIELEGVILTNDSKKNIAWFQPAKVPIKAVIVKIADDEFERMISLSPPLKEKLDELGNFLIYDRLNNMMLGTLVRAFDIDKKDFFRQELIKNCLDYLITLSLQRFSLHAEEKEDMNLNMKNLFTARQLIIDQNGANIDINKLAMECGMSVSRLRLLFKTFFKQPIYKFQQQVRLEEAKRLLKENKKSMSMIAMDLGFSNASHFSMVFKKSYGISPKDFKNSQDDNN
ncbi:helix-turn-helix domain-containing protein [Flammeovirga yaeyamensis]|uniref:Helix-turn-helix domain-containing protein n=1 Tax=Flammeovirga yaeyamensis TaxID=367791 RepID=A0AAX1N4D5_9BACT|nr:helix-turn-helix transcriptional regulator [Flammeovirga yaeyamensis]MBB3698391.1 AraC-like DNA-binding protein [Flammeovirga yaeyamensis]NMF34258.1 helix-turn-helix transcriptional regulator [Flammeovirga yaeyamensis]QWG01241.1 helix-turn-helix domain-containing protein [Flammeovirga yaeyamensis]